MSVSRIFDISRRSLSVYQQAMNVTSHNVANASNPDYTRQRVVLSTDQQGINQGVEWGLGVKIDQVERVRNEYLDNEIRLNNYKYSANDKKSALLNQVEQVFNEPSELGISTMMNSFFNSWSELSVTPNSPQLRENVVYNAKRLSESIKGVNDNLNTLKSDILSEMNSKVEMLNTYIKEVNEINVQISSQGANSNLTNDMLDKRDAILEDISTLANINVTTDPENAAILSVGGVYAADAGGYVQFEVKEVGGKLSLVTQNGESNVTLVGGELAALAETYSTHIPSYMESLDNVTTTLAEKVNEIHRSGYTMDDPPDAGMDFFTGYSGGELIINQAILDDSNKIAISSDGSSGNGDMALEIAALADAKILNNATLNENYSMMISRMGNEKSQSDLIAESTQLIKTNLENQRSSVSGVSIDEEMTNIIKYQRSYDASARLIKVADQMMQTILSLV